MTPLHLSCERDHLDVTTLLLDRGADVNCGALVSAAHTLKHTHAHKWRANSGVLLTADHNNMTPVTISHTIRVRELLLDNGATWGTYCFITGLHVCNV